MTARIIHSDCVEALRAMDAESIDAIVTDPPAGIGFMGREWDSDKGGPEAWIGWLSGVMAEALRVAKPGAHALVWALPRTSHWTGAAIERAGWQVRDCITHLFGTGFPKSVNLGNGRGTALKPSAEFWWLARKPLSGTVAANVLAHGTGALNVDACRVEAVTVPGASLAVNTHLRALVRRGEGESLFGMGSEGAFSPTAGRWPPNLLLAHDHRCGETCAPGCPVAELDRQSGELTSGAWAGTRNGTKTTGILGAFEGRPEAPRAGDSGGASRFFPVFRYVPKPSRAERDAGLWDLPPVSGGEATDRKDGSDGLKSPRAGAGRTGGGRSTHPTVKPIALMEWLVRLVTPPGGTVLDPFLGSGTTGCASVRLGFDFIGIEREAEYVEIAERRIRLAENAPRSTPIGELERGESHPDQLAMFEAP